MLFLFYIFFKVVPPFDDEKVSFNKNLKAIRCGVHRGEDYPKQTVDDFFLIGCEEDGSTMTIEKCTFTDITTHRKFWGAGDYWAHIMLFKKASVDINQCSFTRNKYSNNFISMEDAKDNTYLKFKYNTVYDCNQKSGQKSALIISVYNINEFEHNTITMNEGLLQTRVFEINNHRGCKLIDNNIKNAKYDDGSSVLLCKEVGKSSLSPLEISDCIFYNCHGSDIGSIMQIYKLDTKITIKNTTLQKTSNSHSVEVGTWPNKKTYYKGYFYQFQCNCNPAVAEFIGCHFLDLESNAQSGGGIGLLLTNDNDHELLFENTNFERITFNHPTYSGGAISFSSEVNQNQKTKVTVKGCLFNTVTSKNGGGAIYFNAPTKGLTVENSRFINTYSNIDDIAKGGAIYVKHNEDSSPVTIKNCYFEETKSKYGGAIYIEWSSDSKSDILIDGCTFSKTRANSHGFAITIEKADSNEVTISNCNFNDCVDKKDFFALNLDVSNLNFLYNNIVFSNKNECGGCIILE